MQLFSKVPDSVSKGVFIVVAMLCLSPWISPPIALLLGFLLSQTTGHPFIKYNGKATQWLLKNAVVGLGFGMNLNQALAAGKEGFVVTLFSICSTLLTGILVGRLLKVESKTSYLIASGTAICGGSAIAAVAPIIKAEEKQISVSLAALFLLNSLALLLFPILGHWLNLSEHDFGWWCAIAIHDTSSVVGASTNYIAGSNIANQIATTVKLERALWIIPLSFATAFFYKSSGKAVKIPYFIGLFVLAMLVGTYFKAYEPFFHGIAYVAKRGLTLTLFLIGAGISTSTIKTVGFRPLVQAVIVWVFISVLALAIIELIN